MANDEFYRESISEVADLIISRRNFVQAAAIASPAGSPMGRQTSEVARVMTLARLKAIEPSPTVEIALSGYYAPGDGGEGMFRGVTGAEPGFYVDNGGTVILPKGGNGSAAWIRLHSGPVNVRWFGAKGDGVTNDQPAIQAAIDWVIYRKKLSPAPSRHYGGNEVYIPAGVYVTHDTIHLGYGYGSFTQVVLQGAGKMFLGESGFAGTVIKPSQNDRPAIAVSGGRSNYIRDMAFRGNLYSYIQTNNFGGHPVSTYDVDPAVWLDPAFPASANSRYAPHCAIAVDPYSGPSPTTHTPPSPAYPDIVLPSWLGTTTQYKKGYSSELFLENVDITGFVVGVANKPNNDNNGDYLKIHNSYISHCIYGVSIGNTQSRLVTIRDTVFTRIHTCVTTVAHGVQQGKPQIKCDSVEFNSTIYAFDVRTLGSGTGLVVHNCYGEDLYSLGYGAVTANASLTSANFTGCEFDFQSSWRARGPATTIYDAVGGSGATFQDCMFNIGDARCVALFKGQHNAFSFDNVTVVAGASINHLYEKNVLNATCGIVVAGNTTLQLAVNRFNVFSILYDMTTGSNLGGGWRSKNAVTSAYRQFGIPIYSATVGATPGFGPNIQTFAYDKASAASISQTGRTVTLDLTGSSGFNAATDFAQKGGDVGDFMVDSVSYTLFIVAARTGNVLILIAQNNFDASGNLIPTIGATGYFFGTNCRLYTPAYATQGTYTASSPTVTGVARPDGSAAHITSPTLGLQENDFVYVNNGQYYAMVKATNAQIIAVDSSAKTFTLAGDAAGPALTSRLGLFVRAPTANGE